MVSVETNLVLKSIFLETWKLYRNLYFFLKVFVWIKVLVVCIFLILCLEQNWKPDDIEVVKVEKVPSSDEDDGFGPDVPQILRNQAKSLRLARARAAAIAAGTAPPTANTANTASISPNEKKSPSSYSGMESGPKSRSGGSSGGSNQGDDSNRYYKNMSRERRLIANARERTRVHTISTAFDALRQAIPTYSYNQKLSKLAILRIASAYIKSLSALNGDSVGNSFGQCVNECTKTLQMECRARSRRKGRGKE